MFWCKARHRGHRRAGGPIPVANAAAITVSVVLTRDELNDARPQPSVLAHARQGRRGGRHPRVGLVWVFCFSHFPDGRSKGGSFPPGARFKPGVCAQTRRMVFALLVLVCRQGAPRHFFAYLCLHAKVGTAPVAVRTVPQFATTCVLHTVSFCLPAAIRCALPSGPGPGGGACLQPMRSEHHARAWI